ncbi:glycosyltransferase family 4 protein [Cetobacterium sp. 2A]|uniref:glycosyltransferase family 4 protein n=1 Tax=Cetobacterium sp. 2A TaxID=2754723 RepID=UPI00163BA843|nr:glycosyltransferase family 4 protein [Cetobacterium sp. 2A]MBC2856142.1 glycosyltransferase family 4 protein [Cetobacterium sp. 2A]
MKIIFTANVLWDIYIFRYGVIKALKDKGNEIIVVAPKDKRIDFEKELGIRHIPIDLNMRGMNPVEDLKLMLQLTKIYKKEKPDMVFHYTIKPNIYGSIACKIAGVPSIAVLTGLGYSFVAGGTIAKVAKAMYRFALKFPKEVWVLNSDDKKELVENRIVKADKIFVLPGEGINLERFKKLNIPKDKSKKTVLMIARAFRDKGFYEYVESARIVKETYPDVEFQFLGALGGEGVNGIDEITMSRYVEEGTLTYLGHRKDVPRIIDLSTMVVLPSYREGISKVLMEAASMEKPIVATDVTGCREIVENGKNGYLVPPKDVSALAKAIIKILNLDEKELEEMGRYGREKMEKEFDEKIIIEIYEEKLWS